MLSEEKSGGHIVRLISIDGSASTPMIGIGRTMIGIRRTVLVRGTNIAACCGRTMIGIGRTMIGIGGTVPVSGTNIAA